MSMQQIPANAPAGLSHKSQKQQKQQKQTRSHLDHMATATSFPCAITLDFPFPTARLATVALKALSVDQELSPLVRREFSTVAADTADSTGTKTADTADTTTPDAADTAAPAPATVFRVEYAATTNRMLRVAVSSFLATALLVMEVMEKLDVDVALPAETSSEATAAATATASASASASVTDAPQ